MPDLADMARTAGAMALLALVVPVLRICADKAFRQMFPRVAAGAFVGAVGWILCVAGLAWLWPAFLPWLGGAAMAIGGVLIWRSRPAYGHCRSLPPGSLSMTLSVLGLADRDFYLNAGRTHGPVFKMAQFSSNAVCVLGLERGRRLFREHADALGPSPLPFTQQVMGGFLRYMDDAQHDIYGGLFRKAISRRLVDAAEPFARQVAADHLDRWPRSDRCEHGVAPASDLAQIAHASLLRILFGLDVGTTDHSQFDQLYRRVADVSLMHAMTKAALGDLAALRAWVLGDLLPRSDKPCVLSELSAADPAMPDGVCVDNLVFMLKIATGNVGGLLGWIVAMLAQHPDWRDRLRAAAQAPTGGSGPDPLDAFVLETLRLSQSEYLYRRVERDFLFEGWYFPRGWRVRICVAESHRDPAAFAEPDRFTDRFVGNPASTATFSPFGFDRHACNGVGIALMIARAFLAELARRPDLDAGPIMPLVRDFRHWSHWRPNPDLRVCFRTNPAEEAGT